MLFFRHHELVMGSAKQSFGGVHTFLAWENKHIFFDVVLVSISVWKLHLIYFMEWSTCIKFLLIFLRMFFLCDASAIIFCQLLLTPSFCVIHSFYFCDVVFC